MAMDTRNCHCICGNYTWINPKYETETVDGYRIKTYTHEGICTTYSGNMPTAARKKGCGRKLIKIIQEVIQLEVEDESEKSET